MQFQNTVKTSFDKFAQGIIDGNEYLCQSQLYHSAGSQHRHIGVIRQQCRTHKPEDLMRFVENYDPISELVDWAELKSNCNFKIKKYRESVYLGEIADNSRHGLGIMLYTNGRVYEGYWKNNYKDGKGYERFPNGTIYSGTYSMGKPEGYGTYSWENGQTYEGEWINGMKSGSGIWRGPTGDSYIGEWKEGQAFGYGVHTWVNGDRYEGEFQNCLKHGEGVEKFANGDSYKGFYVNGKPQGYGEYYWAMGSFFKGNFKNGLRDGKGVWKRGPGNTDKYEGDYKQDKKEGYGVFFWENGNIYKGNFSDDLRNGYGEMRWFDGRVYKGEWKNGEQVTSEDIFYENQGTNDESWCAVHNQPSYHSFSQKQNLSLLKSQKQLGRSKKKQQAVESNEDDFLEEKQQFYQQPTHPSFIDRQKRFRARQICSKKTARKLQSQRCSRTYLSSSHSNQHRLTKKQSFFSPSKKAQQGQSQSKMMSSTFYLYKIHGNSQVSHFMPRRAVKTSGGMRQKQKEEQIKYFTRNRINPN